MTKGIIIPLGFLTCGALTCCAPLLAYADGAAHKRASKAAEYRDTKEPVEQPRQRDATPAAEGNLADAPKDRQPANDGESLDKVLEGLLKSGEAR